jgi:hypothetical protein
VPDATATAPVPARRRPQLLGPVGLVVMVAAILLFTAVSIVIEVRSNLGTRFRATVDVATPIRNDAVRVVFHVTNAGTRAGRPDVCEATLLDIRGARAGTATIRLREPIQPGETFDEQAVGTVARAPVNGVVRCRSLSPS